MTADEPLLRKMFDAVEAMPAPRSIGARANAEGLAAEYHEAIADTNKCDPCLKEYHRRVALTKQEKIEAFTSECLGTCDQ